MKIVIKVGGSTLNQLDDSFFSKCRSCVDQGYQLVIIHGGGPAIDEWMKRMGLSPKFVQGRRVTDKATLSIVEMVLAGKVNGEIVSQCQQWSIPAIGLTGIDLGLLQVKRKHPKLGCVGEVISIRHEIVDRFLAEGWVPVLAPLGSDDQGQHYNINADEMAAAVAIDLRADRLVFISNVDGIQIAGHTLTQVTSEQITGYIEQGQISEGMIPKVRAAVQSLNAGVGIVRIQNSQADWFADQTGTEFMKPVNVSH